MPEFPDIIIYIEALQARILGQRLEKVRIAHPFFLRSVDPPVTTAEGKRVTGIRRIGKRIAIGLEDDVWLVLHLMIAGRLHWRETGVALRRRNDIAAFDFESGSLILTEAGTRRRASLHVTNGARLDDHDPGGIEVIDVELDEFTQVLRRRNHTLKRALTDPRLFSGIGNAYSDEILHAARLSPIALTQKLTADEIERLYRATRETLAEWVQRLRRDAGDGFPEKVTAFRREMAVHGRFGQPCPRCNAPIQRIRYASNETNYCPRCQTSGRLLADRSLSRLLKKDWPRTLEELEEKLGRRNDSNG